MIPWEPQQPPRGVASPPVQKWPCLKFRALGFGCRVSGIGFGCRVSVSGVGFRVSGFGFRVSGFGFQVSGFGVWVSGFVFRVSGDRFRSSDLSEDSAHVGAIGLALEPLAW